METKNFIQTQINKMRGRRLLNKALALLRNDGWTTGKERHYADGSRCAVGAIHAAAGYPLMNDSSMFYEDQLDPLVEQVKDAVAKVIVDNGGRDLGGSHATITHFNDSRRFNPETGLSEVLTTLEDAKWAL